MIRHVPLFLVLIALAGCAPGYSMVKPSATEVAKKTMLVQPGTAWNRIPKTAGDVPWAESWTLSGPYLDRVAFLGGVPDGKALVVQSKKAGAQVPVFRADMTPDDLVSMIEGSYRVGGVAAFEVGSIEPAKFLGSDAILVNFDYVDGDKLPRKGRCIMAVLDKKFYSMKLEGAALHYFDAALPEFESMRKSAALRK